MIYKSQLLVMQMADVSYDSVRDWRRRGLLDGIGTQETNTPTGAGRWRWSIEDVVALAVVGWFARRGENLAHAAAMAVHMRDVLVAYSRAPENRSDADRQMIQAERWWVFTQVQKGKLAPQTQLVAARFGSLAQMEAEASEAEQLARIFGTKIYAAAYLVIDAETLAAQLPEVLRDAINSEAE